MEGVLIGLAIAILAVLIGFVGVPFMRKKGWITDERTQTTKQVLEIANLILKNIEMKDNDVKDKTLLVLQIAEIAVRYVEQTSATTRDNKKKKELAQKSVLETLQLMNIEITPDIEKVIELGIESAVNQLPKTNK